MTLFPRLIWWPRVACSAGNPFLLIRELLSLVTHLVLSYSLLFVSKTHQFLAFVFYLLLSSLSHVNTLSSFFCSYLRCFVLFLLSSFSSISIDFTPYIAFSVVVGSPWLSSPSRPNHSKLRHYYSPHGCISHYVVTRSLFVNFKPPPPSLSLSQSIWQTPQHLAPPQLRGTWVFH